MRRLTRRRRGFNSGSNRRRVRCGAGGALVVAIIRRTGGAGGAKTGGGSSADRVAGLSAGGAAASLGAPAPLAAARVWVEVARAAPAAGQVAVGRHTSRPMSVMATTMTWSRASCAKRP